MRLPTDAMLPRPLRPSAPLPALLLLLALLALSISPTSTSTVNSDAVSKAKAKAAWRKARPIGCREVKGEGSDPELPERWWCEAGAKGEKFLVRNGRRLREVARQQEKGGNDGKAASGATTSVAEDDRRATVLLFDAVRKAATFGEAKFLLKTRGVMPLEIRALQYSLDIVAHPITPQLLFIQLLMRVVFGVILDSSSINISTM